MVVKCNLCELVVPKDHAIYISSLDIYFCKKCNQEDKVVNYDHCLHCDTKINGLNEEHFVEVISDFTTMEKRYCCEKCFIKYYKIEGEN